MKIDRYQYNINFDEKNENKVTRLSPDDLITLEVENHDEWEAVMKAMEEEQEQNEIGEMEKATEAREKDEEKRKIELRESIFKVIKENETNSVADEKNDNTEEYKRYAELARQKKEEEIKKREKELDKNIKKTKSKKRWWKKGGDSIEDIIDKNNQR